MRPSSKAWVALGIGVVTYDVLAPPGETLSERVDSALENHPMATIAAVGAVALHLLNVFDNYNLERYDIIHQAATVVRKER